MKTLIFLRHAKSDWTDRTLKDFDRELNDRGVRVAPKMGGKLKEMGVKPDMVYASPAKRTTQTAELLLERMDYDLEDVDFIEDIYEASARSLMNLVNDIDDHLGTVMFIGHNPSITYLSEYLIGEALGDVPTCSAVSIKFDIQEWKMISQGLGSLDFYVYPKQFDF